MRWLEWIFIGLLIIFAFGLFMVDVWDPDFWWHLKTGEWIVEHRGLPEEDPFSFATLQKDPYTSIDRVRFILTQYWLAQAIMYKVYSLFGFPGISIFRSLILTITILIIILILRYHSVQMVFILPLIAGAILTLRTFTGERPQLFSFLFSALLLYFLERIKNTYRGEQKDFHPPPRYLPFTIPILMILWANIHGGYLYGIVIILIYLVSGWIEILIQRYKYKSDTRIRPHTFFTIVGIISILSTLINPNKYLGLIYTFHDPSSIFYFQSIMEMIPTYRLYTELPIYSGMLILTTLAIGIDIVRQRKVDIYYLLLFLFNALFSLSAVRYVPFFIISGSFLLGRYLNMILPLKIIEKKRPLEITLLVMIFIGISAFSVFKQKITIDTIFMTGVDQNRYPHFAVKFLRNLPPRRIFNAYGWGGYLIWNLYPKYKVFIDGRNLNHEIFLQYSEVMSADRSERYAGRPKWKAILDGYQIDYVLLCPAREGPGGLNIVFELINDKDWHLIYADNISLLFIRDKGEFRDIIRRYNLPPELAYETVLVQALEVARTPLSRTQKMWAYVVAAEMFVRLNKREDAIAYIKKALEIEPDNPELRLYARAMGVGLK